MRANHGSRALAIEVEVADVEIAAGAVDAFTGGGEECAGEPVFRVVRDVESVVEVFRFDKREDRAKDFFLCETGASGAMSAKIVGSM